MTLTTARGLHITWLCLDDKGGGVISVAQGCCKEAALAGHEVTLLLALPPTGHASEYGRAKLTSLDATPPYADIPARLAAWLEANPQDILILNGCEQVDCAVPYLPAALRVVYCVHDTAERYFGTALRCEADLDAVIAVSETVAARFRFRMSNPNKLYVVHNGTGFPTPLDDTLARSRTDDLLFLGGDNALKGAHDILALWPALTALGFGGRLHWFGAVGDGMRRQIAALPGADQIVMLGRRPRHQIFDIAGRSKVVLMLSRVEPFGMVTVECVGMGCLAVAWDIDTGTKEIVGASECVFAPLGDFTALARGVNRAIEMHGRKFTASTARIRHEFSETAMWTRYASTFESILSTRRAIRVRAGQPPPPYRRPVRLFQLLPSGLRAAIRAAIGRSPRLGYALRDFRGK
jgi:glycosyltransferase involved in cell wall biosynthesis